MERLGSSEVRFHSTNGTVTNLETYFPPDGTYSPVDFYAVQKYSFNAQETILATATNSYGVENSLVGPPGNLHPVAPVATDFRVPIYVATAIADDGVLAGYRQEVKRLPNPSGDNSFGLYPRRAVLVKNGAVTDLGVLPGFPTASEPTTITIRDGTHFILGTSGKFEYIEDSRHQFLWHEAGAANDAAIHGMAMIDLDKLPGQRATVTGMVGGKIELSGETSYHIEGTDFYLNIPTTWRNGRFIDPNTLLRDRSSCNLEFARFNDHGIGAGTATYPDGRRHGVVLVPVELTADCNRDGIIDDKDRGKITAEKPWRFWTNDDDDSGDTGGTDMSRDGEVSNFSTTFVHPDSSNTGVVDGTRDLIDFFPVYLNIKPVLDLLPPTDGFTYNLKQEGGNANFVYTDLKASAASDYLRKLSGTRYDNTSTIGGANGTPGAITHRLTPEGVALDPQWLRGFDEDGFGVLLFEARARSDKPIVLEVFSSNGHKMVEVELSISFSPVDQMFRHKNLMNADNATGGAPDYATGNDTRHTEPENYPDSLCNGKNFIFVHGYNVNPDAARGWNSEIFKRMYHAGSKAKFVGVTWNGAETQIPGMDITVNYHKNVDHAFQTAKGGPQGVGLAAYINSFTGEVVVAGHSLGNVVVASSISDWQAHVASYFMIDGAIASEAFATAAIAPPNQSDSMTHPDWIGYANQAYAAEWHKLFPSEDARNKLTWRGRVSAASATVFNFYSSGEEVLAEHPNSLGNPSIFDVAYTEHGVYLGKYAWALQEKLKGRIHELQNYPILGSVYGGWGFSRNFGHPPHTPSVGESAGFSDLALRTEPVFDPGFTLTEYSPSAEYPFGQTVRQVHAAEWVPDLTDPTRGAATAAAHANTLLAEMFPARTLPTGVRPLKFLGANRNFDMQTQFKNGWPTERDLPDWQHTDIKTIAFSYIFPAFDVIVTLGDLK
jgi:hypothetical protein